MQLAIAHSPMQRRGYSLASYDRDEVTGRAVLTYERTIAGVREVEVVERDEPNSPRQQGWDAAYAAHVLAQRSREEMYYDGLYVQVTKLLLN